MALFSSPTDRDYGDEWQPRASEDAHTPSAPPPITLVGRLDRKATVARLAPWVAATRHDCTAAESTIDALIAGSRDQATALARQDAELAHLRSVVAHQAGTIIRQRKQVALARQAARNALCAPEAPPLVLVALATVLCRLEALGARINRAWAHEGWGR